jgi:ribosomal protein L37AE/L43A
MLGGTPYLAVEKIDEKTCLFNGKRYCLYADGYFLRVRKIGGKSRTILLHRVVWEYHNGSIPDGFDVHHKNGVKTDNRLENLLPLKRGDHLRLHNSGIDRMYSNHPVLTKVCPVCGEKFETRRETKIYCSNTCGHKQIKRCFLERRGTHVRKYSHDRWERIKDSPVLLAKQREYDRDYKRKWREAKRNAALS